jgi:hypothetical protein
MRKERTYGLALVASSIVLLVMGAVHPSSLPDTVEALEHVSLVDAVAHTLAIAGVWMALWGLVGLSRWLGFDQPLVVAALLAFALPAAGITVAAALDGFVIPKLALQALEAEPATRETLWVLIRFCVLTASALTRIYMLLGAFAVALWSWVIFRKSFSVALPLLGGSVALAAVATTFGGPAYISVHVLLLLVVVQSAWMVWAGLLMLKNHPAV